MLQKHIFLKKYYNKINHKIFSSKFIYDDVNNIIKIKGLDYTIEGKDLKKIHFLFLFLLSNGILPHIKNIQPKKKLYVSKKEKKQIFVHIKKKLQTFVITNVLNLVTNQVQNEKTPVQLTKTFSKIVLWDVSLPYTVQKLQTINGYIPRINLGVNFCFFSKKITFFEKIFFFEFNQFIKVDNLYFLEIIKDDNN